MRQPWVPFALVLLLSPLSLNAEDQGVRLGYALGFSAHPLQASKIDPRFEDLPALGHFSSFFAEFPLGNGLSWSLSPGAANFEPEGRTQFHFQDNLVGLGYKTSGPMFLTAGAGLGGAIASLTTKAEATAGVTEAVVLKASAFLWAGWTGLGWQIDERWELTGQARYLGLFHDDLSRLNALYGALTLSSRL